MVMPNVDIYSFNWTIVVISLSALSPNPRKATLVNSHHLPTARTPGEREVVRGKRGTYAATTMQVVVTGIEVPTGSCFWLPISPVPATTSSGSCAAGFDRVRSPLLGTRRPARSIAVGLEALTR